MPHYNLEKLKMSRLKIRHSKRRFFARGLSACILIVCALSVCALSVCALSGCASIRSSLGDVFTSTIDTFGDTFGFGTSSFNSLDTHTSNQVGSAVTSNGATSNDPASNDTASNDTASNDTASNGSSDNGINSSDINSNDTGTGVANPGSGKSESPVGPIRGANEGRTGNSAPLQADIGINATSSPDRPSSAPPLPDYRNLKRSEGHKALVTGIFRTGGADDLVSVDEAGLVLLWKGGKEPFELFRMPVKLSLAAFSSNTNTLSLVDNRNVLYVFPGSSETAMRRRDSIPNRIVSLDVSPDGKSVLAGCADSRVYRWRFFDEENAGTRDEREKSFERYVGHASVVSSVLFYPLGRVFFSGDWMGRVSVTTLFDADRFSGRFDKNIFEGRAFSEENIRQAGSRKDNGGVSVLRCTQDGRFMVLGDEQGEFELWQVRGFKQLTSVSDAHRGSIIDADESRGEGIFISLGRDGMMRGWKPEVDELERYKLTKTFEVPVPKASRLAVQDSGPVVVGFSDGVFRHFNPKVLQEQARQKQLGQDQVQNENN